MDNIKFIQLLGSGVGYFYNVLSDNTNTQILDPLTTVIRLSILSFKIYGTKISINYNKIEYQEPTLLQGTFRWKNGDKRSDLHNLCNPLKICRLKYSPEDDERIKNIYNKSIEGLGNLKSLYEHTADSTKHALSHYINILNGEDLNIDENQLEIYNKFNSIWSDKDIDIINDLLIEIENKFNNNQDIDSYLNSIDAILNGKDNKIREILNNTITGKI
jgi:hypothetical protein